MTAIAGYTDGKTWAIAADSGIFEGGNFDGDEGSGIYWTSPVPKIWRVENSLVGVAGDAAIGDLVQTCASGDPHKLASFLRESVKNGSEIYGKDWNVLVVTKKAVFYLDDLFAVSSFTRGYMTVGAAGSVALGALAVSAEMKQAPRDAVRLAIKVAIANHMFAVGPVKYKVLGEEKDLTPVSKSDKVV